MNEIKYFVEMENHTKALKVWKYKAEYKDRKSVKENAQEKKKCETDKCLDRNSILYLSLEPQFVRVDHNLDCAPPVAASTFIVTIQKRWIACGTGRFF